ncbi:Zn-ribbon-containing protein [Oceanisphaera pacifica]|uniref:Zn-ribbon-containing protein n=1 Tax=Oceanisphaera pacifica TaxID=2818389 RepID=A0ABS3NJ47_9GAMM|nr:Zn-ribbon-containing protein [Oceanisphaera pacifica]MBO1520597.1 Zn-ribbon-containing protein [Oceanisphaera pacifica]
MWVCELHFDCYQDTSLAQTEPAIRQFIDALRHNGQIVGREFPTAMHAGWLVCRVVCPEQDSLHPRHYSRLVQIAITQLHQAGLTSPKTTVKGQDLNSDTTDECTTREWQLLYTTYLHSCSPLRCGEHFSPVPLYQTPAIANGDFKKILKWQEDWEACDQLQMNGSILEHGAVEEISNHNSRLSRRGRELCKRIEALTHTATYYYLYRVGGESLATEQHRPCPSCGQPWHVSEPIHGIFDFKCEPCRLVSNLSWDFKE